MNQLINKKVRVGKKLAKYNNQILGFGLYQEKGEIYSSIMGTIISSKPNHYQITNSFPYNKAAGVKIGSIVYAKIIKVKQDESLADIIQIDGLSVTKQIQGAIRRQHIRQKMIDQVSVVQSFKPGDIIKAKVISMGDSLRSLYLSTAGQDFGVLICICQQTKRVMLPYDWQTMVDVEEGIKQERKVAKPQTDQLTTK